MTRSKFLKETIKQLKKEWRRLSSAKDEEKYFLKRSEETIRKRERQMKEAKNQAFDTVALWGLYGREDMQSFKSLTLPLFMSTTGGPYDSLIDGSLLLNYKTIDDPNKAYTRIDNLTTDHLAMKLAALEGLGVKQLTQGLCTSSGMSAIMMATMPFLEVGDNFVSSNRVYGGTQQLFEKTYPKSGWQVCWVENPQDFKEWEEKIDKKTNYPQHKIAKKLMKLPDGEEAYGFLMSFNIKGGFEAAKKFAQFLILASKSPTWAEAILSRSTMPPLPIVR